ncbi:hypothetical protein DC3_53030 [Deinococcus cellulosilyticus NBRC 106333 = KACC 11606]|uniref:Uncharacterized protein n=1 Tax=Deinococcus cellulosilyticus (strain DSM 18568 / NBRC 106333 / KACC 11606 / 5516J-15) TaxID=1223518 RepID=A0A511NAX7_DEIC1|nr:hypothetical protein DC3_53030 [Deinococcus cellulosilyticus NBRC 106333 = KACC 11606]
MNRPQILKLPANQREISQGPGKYSVRLNLDLFSAQDLELVQKLSRGEGHFTPMDSEGNPFPVPKPLPASPEEWMMLLRLVHDSQLQLLESLQDQIAAAQQVLEEMRAIEDDGAFFLAYDPFHDLEQYKEFLKIHAPEFVALKQAVDQRRWNIFMGLIRKLDHENREWVRQHGSQDLQEKVQLISASMYFFSTIKEQLYPDQDYKPGFYDAQFGFPMHQEPFQQYVLERVAHDYPYGIYTDGRYQVVDPSDQLLPDLSGFPSGQWVRLTGYPHDLSVPGKRAFLDLMISSFLAEQFYCVRIKTPVGEVLYPQKPLPTLVDHVWHFFINPECAVLKASEEFGVNQFLIYTFLDPVTFEQLKGDREMSIEMPMFTKVNADFKLKLHLLTRMETQGKMVFFKLVLHSDGGVREVMSEGSYPFSQMYYHRYIIFNFDGSTF